jgi:hypothetical protein
MGIQHDPMYRILREQCNFFQNANFDQIKLQCYLIVKVSVIYPRLTDILDAKYFPAKQTIKNQQIENIRYLSV